MTWVKMGKGLQQNAEKLVLYDMLIYSVHANQNEATMIY